MSASKRAADRIRVEALSPIGCNLDMSKVRTIIDAEYASLVNTLKLIKRGLADEKIRSKPILEFDPEAESCPLRSLEDIVNDALAHIEGDATP